jgi:Zinc carboxypeptidase
MLKRFLLPCFFLSQLFLPAAVPTPESHFGHPIGADRKLLDWSGVVSYFQDLAKSSDRIQVKEIGKSAEGRPLIAAWISAPETLKNLDHYRQIQAKLADPRKTTRAEADELIHEGKAVVMITCSIHATEVASTHTAVEFAYKMLTEDNPKFRAILNNVIFILVPSENPDGVDIVTKWYRRSLGSRWEGTAPPQLYQKYVGHDNNRDWYIFSQPETRAIVSQLFNVWHPQIVYDVHQQGPYASRMFVPPWMDPIDPNIDAIISQLCNSVGATMAADLTAAGKTGIAIDALYDFWTPARDYEGYHGGLRILSESASAKLATPITVTPDQIRTRAAGYNPRERSWNYLEPWEGGTWRLRDIIDYQEIAWTSCLYQAAIRREDFLRDFYEVGERAVARRHPYAFVIPNEQFDPGAAQKMLETLAFGQVEIEKASAPFEADGKQYKKDTYIIRMQQPYSSWAKTLLEVQHYPDLRQYPDGPPKRPYDVTAQTLPMLFGVDVDTIEKPFQDSGKLVSLFPFQLDHPLPKGSMPTSDVITWKALAGIWDSTPGVFRDVATGNFYLMPVPGMKVDALPRPRIGLYKSFVPSIDEGWTRWLLDAFGLNYERLDNGDIQYRETLRRYAVVIIPDEPEAILDQGFTGDMMPPRYVGGLGKGGAENLKWYAENGGTVVFLNRASDYAIDHLDLPVKDVIKNLPPSEFYSPGSLLNVTLDLKSPLCYGMPEKIQIWSEQSPVFDVPEGAGVVVARYPESNILASGWLLGGRHLAGKAALVDIPLGKGHVILFGMRPQYRGQSYRTFKLLFNTFVLVHRGG